MLTPECGNVVGLVLFCVAFLAHAKVGSVHQVGHAGQHLLTIELLVPQVFASDPAHLRETVAEAQDTLELLPLFALAILGVVEILEPACRVVSDSLNLCRRTAGYVHVLPGRRHFQVLDAFEDLLLAHDLARAWVT